MKMLLFAAALLAVAGCKESPSVPGGSVCDHQDETRRAYEQQSQRVREIQDPDRREAAQARLDKMFEALSNCPPENPDAP